MIRKILSKVEGEASAELAALGFADGLGALRNLKALSAGSLKGRMDKVFSFALASPSPDSALNNLERIDAGGQAGLSGLSDGDLEKLVFICGSSQLLSSTVINNPEYISWLFSTGLFESRSAEALSEEMLARIEGLQGIDEASRELRLFKQKEYLRIGSRDLLGVAPLEETTREISDLASACLEAAVRFGTIHLKNSYGAPLYEEAEGEKKEAGFCVLGLGKLGGRELNFSSDIDIIYIYESNKGETTGIDGNDGSRISLHAFFVKLSMLVTKLISAVTADGFVFRVDLDLRPEGRSGDAANSLRSAEIYYESWGQPWERAAMIKARPVAGSLVLGEEFLLIIRPFIFRKYLDFTAIEEIKSMKEKINLSLLRRNPDAIDVKLGAGGIREIEFFCQALQLIHAGKDKEIRERNTLKAIELLKQKKYIKEEEAASLSGSYIFLRNLEHRIQIVEGRQSQALPASPEALERLARMMGFKDTEKRKAGEFFWDEYRKTTSIVHEVFRSLFYRSEEAEEAPDEIKLILSPELPEDECQERLSGLGFRDTAEAYKNMLLLRDGPHFVHLSPKARVILQRLAPVMLMKAASSPDPDRSLSHLERFVSAIGARTTFYSLLNENPRVLEELIKLFGTSDFLSRDLVEHPESLDLLLSEELTIPYKRKEEMLSSFLAGTSSTKDYEDKLDSIRKLKSQELFRIGINDIAGGLTPRQVSVQMTFLAEASLEAAIRIATQELSERFGGPSTGTLSVIGMGKLGGRELIYGSDLDIIFVYPDSTEGMTTGPKQISSHEYFVKLGQRIISVLTLRTREGFVFNVDARLRPSGSSGPLVVSRDAFIKYHSGQTQVWERQAALRARPVAGDLKLGCSIVADLEEALFKKELATADIDEMLHVRKRMELEIAKENSERYNIKTGAGGIVDIEFLAQALALKWGGEKRSLRTPDTRKALKRLHKESLLNDAEYRLLSGAYSFMRSIETRQRVVHDRPEGYIYRDSVELTTLARRMGYSGESAGAELLKDYEGFAEKVRSIYIEKLEGLKDSAKR